MANINDLFWACNSLGDFLLKLYHKRTLQATNWKMAKGHLQHEFENYLSSSVAMKSCLRQKLYDYCQTIDITILLQRINAATESENHCLLKIDSDMLLEYRAQKLENYIEQQCILENDMVANYNITDDIDQSLLKTVQEIDEHEPIILLAYKGRRDQERIMFEANATTCFICQRKWNDQQDFQNHLKIHNEMTNFIALNLYDNICEMQSLKIGYHICSKTGNYRFYVAALSPNIVVEKIILIFSDFVYYIHKEKLPCDLIMNTPIVFDLDYRIFLQHFETPIVVIYKLKNSEHIQCVEQYHLIIKEKSISDQENLSNTYLNPTEKIKFISNLDLYLYKNEPCPGFDDYNMRNNTFTAENYCEALKMLLHFEDFSKLSQYRSLVQHDVRLQNLEEGCRFYTWHLMPEFESNLLGPHDELLLVPRNESAGNEQLHSAAKQWIMTLNNWEREISFVNNYNNNNRSTCEGLIEKYKNETIIFQLKQFNMSTYLTTYTMYFRPSRYSIRQQLRGVELLQQKHAQILNRFFFPTLRIAYEYSGILNIVNKISLHEVDQSLANDPEQMLAVKSILNGVGNIAPYIVIGPPGTGKTSILVKGIYALYSQQSTAKILVMSNSNFVCDEIALRLIEMLNRPIRKANAILRLYAHSYIKHKDKANKLLLQYSNFQNDHFYPKVETIHKFRIVVCTVNVASKLSLADFGHDTSDNQRPKPIYTHIVVDEAHSLTEGQIVMGLLCTLEKKTKLIIAGDPNQLGTHITSTRSAFYGMGISLMERLLKLDIYQVDETSDYNRDFMIRLCRNYRSHEQFINILNKFFYEGRLLAKVDPALVDIGTKWHRLPDFNLPIIFHSVFGQCIKNTNKSMCNAEEGLVVLDYLSDLLYYGINGEPISQKDIGIITPYLEQYKILSQLLYCRKWYDINCGTIESFQGMERQIILISFVRTELPTGRKNKRKTGLGFLKDPRRICTLLSRAKSLMILIGDPRVLWASPALAHIITECHRSGNLMGNKFELPELEDVYQ